MVCCHIYILSCVVKRLRKLIHAACSSSRICKNLSTATSRGSQFERSGTRPGMPTFRSGGVLGLSSNHISSLGIPARPKYIYIYICDRLSFSIHQRRFNSRTPLLPNATNPASEFVKYTACCCRGWRDKSPTTLCLDGVLGIQPTPRCRPLVSCA